MFGGGLLVHLSEMRQGGLELPPCNPGWGKRNYSSSSLLFQTLFLAPVILPSLFYPTFSSDFLIAYAVSVRDNHDIEDPPW